MVSFLKKILEPSEEDAFDYLTWMERPSSINIFEGLRSEDVLPSPNVGLPSALIPRQPPGPAYVTHTGPLVRRLRQQERLGRAAPGPRPRREPRSEPRREPRPRPAPSPAPGPAPGPAPLPEHPAGAAAGQPAVCHMIIFARKPPVPAPPPSPRPAPATRSDPAAAQRSKKMLPSDVLLH